MVVALGAALLVPGPAAAATPPRPGTFAGTLGVSVPKGGAGAVRAIDRATRTVRATKHVGRSGRFSLTLPPGGYLVVGTVARPDGRLVQKRVAVSLKAGQKRKGAKLTARRTRKRKAGRHATAAFVQERGNVTPGRVAVEIPDVTGTVSDPELAAMRPGINDFLTTDVANTGGAACGLAVLEIDRRADIVRELELQQSPYFDPATRTRRNFIVADVEVRGTIREVAGGRATVTLTMVDKRSGKQLGSRSVTFGDDVFDRLEELGRGIADDLCKLSDVYEVTLDVHGDGRFATHDGSGTIHTVLQARRSAGGEVWRATGPLQWTNLVFTSKTQDCPMTDPVAPLISWSVTIHVAGENQLQVTWTRDGNDAATASIDCYPTGPDEPDPPPVAGQPGPALLNTAPESFVVPFTGGTQPLTGEVSDGGDGFFNTGTMKITPAGVG